MGPPLTGVVLHAPVEVEKHDELEWDPGWWISAALRKSKPGDRLVVYRTLADPGLVGVFDVATEAFKSGDLKSGDLGWAAYGRPTDFDVSIPRSTLIDDPVLSPVFANLQGRRYLPVDVAERLEDLLPSVAVGLSKDPLPEPGDPNWEWRPTKRRWGIETVASDAIAFHKSAWRALGFVSRPERERSPFDSKRRTDLKGRDSKGRGIIAEVKHFVAMSTLDEQLDPYLDESRRGGGHWVGHLIALTAYTGDIVRAVERRHDVRLWVCDRNSNGDPYLLEIA